MEHNTARSKRLTLENTAIHSWQAALSSETWTNSMELAKQLIRPDTVAMKLPEYFHQAALVEQPFGSVLVSIDEALKRLVSVQKAARSFGVEISVFACTDARRAVAINNDWDSRDHKYLGGLTSFGNLHGYCGGLDAAISRAVIYAPHADVVCFRSATPDVSEAKRFAAAIQLVCPEKQFAFGYSPKPDGPRWNEMDHAAFESELYSVGFNYYFFEQFGSTVFPHFPSANRWVMLDDALRMHLPAREHSALPITFRTYAEHSHGTYELCRTK